MSSGYPGTIDTWPNVSAGQLIASADINNYISSILNIENTLGTNPQGGAATVSARLTGLMPAGALVPYAGFTAPSGFLLCDGSAVSRTTYGNLFAVLSISTTGNTTNGSNVISGIPSTTNMKAGMPVSGTGIPASTTISSVDSSSQIHISNNATSTNTGGALVVAPFGVGDGSTTFNVPDLRSRAPIGSGQGTGLTNRVLGASGGEETHTLSTSEIPSHNHNMALNAAGSGNPLQVAGGNGSSLGSMNTANTGGGGAHNNMQPFLAVSFIIKY